MVNHLERSLAFRRWLAVAVAFVLSAGIWTASSQRASAATATVRMTNFTFNPADITINVGDTINWVNEDKESHAPEGGSFSAPEVRPGETYSHKFTAPEEIPYICRFHTYITGTIHVVAAGAAPATTAPRAVAAPTTAAPAAPAAAAAPTTAAPAAAKSTATRGSAFQEVPDDPSARKPPGAAGATAAAGISSASTPSTPTTAAPTTAAPTMPAPKATSSDFQEVPQDPSATHGPGHLAAVATDQAPAGGTSPPGSPTAVAAGQPLPGSSLNDGTVLAPFKRVNGAKEFHLTMAETTIEVSPGVVKQAYAFNGIVPGPVLRVDEGDRVRIVVDNELPFPTSTHWHGMILPNDQDGVGGITQADIPPGGQYVYEWTAVATGTHWYHAHSSGRHIGKGLYGPLEVVPKKGDFTSDRDYRLMIGDTDLGFTFNGRSFPSTPQLEAEVGETVRLRLINAGDQVHAIHLHGVPFKVVAQDGIPSEQPERMDTLTIAPGQTFDLLFKERYPGKWALHCHMFVHSHMTDDVHPPGESGMNGLTTIVNITDPATAKASDTTTSEAAAGDTTLPSRLDAISSIDRSDSSALSLVAVVALLALAYTVRRRTSTTNQKP